MVEKEKIIKSFLLEEELDDYVVDMMYQDFLKMGLILLPSGNTFEKSIYPKLDALFDKIEFQTFNSAGHETKEQKIEKHINPDLKLSHLDELIPKDENGERNIFANAIKSALPNISSQLAENFYSIDIDDSEAFDRYLKATGPRVIYAGLGADPNNAHFAFIGEDFINTDICAINLGQAAIESHGCTQAITIGTDILKLNSIEKIVVVAKGEGKAESIKAAFEDDTTGLGYVIQNHADKLVIVADEKALDLI